MEFLTVKEAAEYLRCSEPNIRKKMGENEIPFHRVGEGGKVLFYLPELREWVLKQGGKEDEVSGSAGNN